MAQEELLQEISAKLTELIGLTALQPEGASQPGAALKLARLGVPWEDIAAILGQDFDDVVKPVLQPLLSTQKRFDMYCACDGSKTQKEIAGVLDVNQGGLSRFCAECLEARVMIQDEETGKARAIVDPRRLGLRPLKEA